MVIATPESRFNLPLKQFICDAQQASSSHQFWKPNLSSSASRIALQMNQDSSKPMTYLWAGGDI